MAVDHSRPVTGYPAPPPYAQPYPHPPPPNYPNYPQQPPSYNAYAARATFVRRFVVAMVFLFVIIGSLLLIVWLVLRPKIPDFRVSSFSVSDLNVSADSLSGKWSVGFDVFNPNNKMSIEYDEIAASVFYRNGLISDAMVPPFVQATRVRSEVNATLAAAGSFVGSRVASGIATDVEASGDVGFNLRVLARVEFRRGGWRLRRRLLRVLCRDVLVSVGKNGSGKMSGGERICGVVV